MAIRRYIWQPEDDCRGISHGNSEQCYSQALMRKPIAITFVTADGVMQAPGGQADDIEENRTPNFLSGA